MKSRRYERPEGASAHPDANDGVFLTAAQVRRRYGGISAMTLHRWLHAPDLDFCQPILIGKRRYWKLTDLENFERRRVREKGGDGAPARSRS